MPQLSIFDLSSEVTLQEDINTVMKELCVNCRSCRLSLIHPKNLGMTWRGNINSKIAVVGEAPGDKETMYGRPLVGPSGEIFERWMSFIGVNTRTDCFITNVLQCQPGKDVKKQQKAPDKDEIKACFGPRALRAIKAMPNLEVVLTLGWVAAKAILGGEPKSKTHEGVWHESSLLPGKAVYCLVHPAFIMRDPTPEKNARVEQFLRLFKREYLESIKNIPSLAAQAKQSREERERT